MCANTTLDMSHYIYMTLNILTYTNQVDTFSRHAYSHIGAIGQIEFNDLPLGRPRPVYKSHVEPILNTNWEYPKMHDWCKFGISNPNLGRIIAPTTQISRNSELKWPNDLEGQGQWPPLFNIPQENPEMHIWCKFGDFNINPLQVISRTSRIS